MQKIITGLLLCFSLTAYAADQTNKSPIGLWKTIDDVTGKPKAIVQIWQTTDKMLYGRVLKIFPQPGRDMQNELCTACQGNLHNKRILGMMIMQHLKPTSNNAREWGNGKILDPKNGRTYNCTIQLSENGEKLNARGYIGFPLFGRTQTWLRVQNLNNNL